MANGTCSMCMIMMTAENSYVYKKGPYIGEFTGGYCKECTKKYNNKNKEKIRIRQKKYVINNSHKVFATQTINWHRTCGFNVNVKHNELTDFVINHPNCALCGIELDYSRYTKSDKRPLNNPSLDRIDSNCNDINIDNIQMLCIQCNMGKCSGTDDEYIAHCRRVISYRT